jgi:hypothetical protein
VNDTIEGAAEDQVVRYATAVRAAFADLPAPERELLLEDLEDHLAEVADEDDGPLQARLGAPEAYAAELRASAGLPAPGAAAAEQRRSSLRESAVARRLQRSWRAAVAHPAGGAIVGFLPELRPAWWVLRGYLAVQAVAVAGSPLFAGSGLSFPIPALFESQLLGLLATVAAVVASVRWGRREPGGAGRRALTMAGNAALALFGVALLLQLGADEAAGDSYRPGEEFVYAGPVSGLRTDGEEITNIFPFDADGRPLRDVYLVDQDGDPVVATHYDNEYVEARIPLDRDGNEVPNRYPQVQHELDPATGQRQPGPTPEFRPPPGPVRSP